MRRTAAEPAVSERRGSLPTFDKCCLPGLPIGSPVGMSSETQLKSIGPRPRWDRAQRSHHGALGLETGPSSFPTHVSTPSGTAEYGSIGLDTSCCVVGLAPPKQVVAQFWHRRWKHERSRQEKGHPRDARLTVHMPKFLLLPPAGLFAPGLLVSSRSPEARQRSVGPGRI